MRIIKRIGRGLSSSILKFSLLMLAVIVASLAVLGSSDNLKQSLADSGVYDQATDSLIASMDQPNDNQNNSDEGSDIDQATLRAAASAALPANKIQTWTEEFIDSFYRWLRGDVSVPDFRIDLTESKQIFAESIGESAVTRLEGLPACSARQNLEIARSNEFDPFSAECRPAVDLQAEKQRLVSELLSEEEFLPDTVLTADDLSQTDKGINFTDNNAPKIFQIASSLPLILGGIIALSVLGLIWLSDDRRQGSRIAGNSSLGTGIFLLVGSLLFWWLFNRAKQPGGNLERAVSLDNSSLQDSLLEVIKTLFQQINSRLIIFGVIYLAVGLGVLAILHFGWKRSKNPGQLSK